MHRHARYSIGDYTAAATAYRRGLELEPNNAAMKTGLRNSEAHTADTAGDTAPPSGASSDPRNDTGAGGLGGLADTLRNMGGAGAGTTPDLANLMNNPAMMQMAQRMMANGGLERLMSDPTVANMVSCIETHRRVVALLIIIDGSVEQWRWHAIHARTHGKCRLASLVSSSIDNRLIYLIYPQS